MNQVSRRSCVIPVNRQFNLGSLNLRCSTVKSPMDKIDALISAIQKEIRRHDWNTIMVPVDDDEPNGQRITVPGCPVCRKQIGTCRNSWITLRMTRSRLCSDASGKNRSGSTSRPGRFTLGIGFEL
jgi:hypothetical protein